MTQTAFNGLQREAEKAGYTIERATYANWTFFAPILAGRTSNMTCPFCRKHELEEEGSAWGKRFACDGCGKFIEVPPEN